MNKLIVYLAILFLFSCNSPDPQRGAALFNSYCAMCHITPDINGLPRHIWEHNVLPDMGARLGIKYKNYDPLTDLSLQEINAINQTGIYPKTPIIAEQDWIQLRDYILALAPDSLLFIETNNVSQELSQFAAKTISFNSRKGSLITFLKYDTTNHQLLMGDMEGNISSYNFGNSHLEYYGGFGSAITDFTEKKEVAFITTVGLLNPTDLSSGRILMASGNSARSISGVFHRPVNTLIHDLNNNGQDELIVSEFGNLTGKLSLLAKVDGADYIKTILLDQPGTIRVVAKDMNDDGRDDLIALTSQGDETITILYQEDNLTFRPEKAIRFSPVYGSSWFELIDYDSDGDDDIITVNGDNADKSFVLKPYHGLRIHINDGNNNFEEKYFYPFNGATRFSVNDFDQDGDLDFAIISTFPDYQKNPALSFVYLENTNSPAFNFLPFTFKESNLGRWFLMDTGDVDGDGDEDIILSSFTYSFTPVPKEVTEFWKEQNVNILVLENKLKSNRD